MLGMSTGPGQPAAASCGDRPPAEAFEIDATALVELHAFALEKLPLLFLADPLAAQAHLATRVDHAMPRNRRSVRERVQGIADLSGVTPEASKRRDLTVRGHTPGRYGAHHFVDALIGGATIDQA